MELDDEKNKIDKIDINDLRLKIKEQKKQSDIVELIDNIDENIDKINTDIINEHLNKNLKYINKNAYLARLAKSVESDYSTLYTLMKFDDDFKKEIDDKYKQASNDFKQKQAEKAYNLSPLKTRSKTKIVNKPEPETPTKLKPTDNAEIEKSDIPDYNDIVSKINSWKTFPRKINEDKFIKDLSVLITKSPELTRNIVQKYNLYERFNKSQIQKRKDEREKNKNEKEKQKGKVEDKK